MRRKEREITDLSKIQQIMEKCTCLHLGLNDQGKVYVVPVNFGYEVKEGQFTLYFHGAKEGRKAQVIAQNPNVGFEMETGYALVESALPCDFSALYESIIGEGQITILTDSGEKRDALNQIMRHYSGKDSWDFPELMLKNTNVFQLNVQKLSCKMHKN